MRRVFPRGKNATPPHPPDTGRGATIRHASATPPRATFTHTVLQLDCNERVVTLYDMKDQEKKPEAMRDLDDILDVMTGGDGGVAFVKLLFALRAIAKDDQPAAIHL